MKGRKIFIALLASLCAIFALCAVACSSQPLVLSDTALTLEAYDDYQLTLPNGEKDVVWTSSDQSVATVKDGLISCVGKIGEVTITAKADGKEGTCKVTVTDSELPARLLGGEIICYVNGLTQVNLPVRYNEKLYTAYTVKKITIADTSVATAVDGKIKGLKVGETTAEITVSWKGKNVSSRDEIKIVVKEEYTIQTDSSSYAIYDVNASSSVKKNTAKITPQIIVRGGVINGVEISASIIDGADYFTIDENFNVTAKSVNEEQTGKVKFSCTYENKTIETEVEIKIYPNFVQKQNNEFQSTLPTASYGLYDQEVGGRQGVYRYYTGQECAGTADWIKWGNHLELQTLKTLESKSQYDYVVNQCGYALVSFDVYYEGQYNSNDSIWEYRGVSVNAQYGPNDTDYLYYVGHVKNTPEKLVIVDGKQTNALVPKTWVTFYIDFRMLADGAQLDSYLANNRVGDVTYVDNIRYWYDDASICDVEKANVDLEKRELAFTDGNAKIVAPENEFMSYSSDYTEFVKTGENDYYTYTAKDEPDYGGKNLLSETLVRRVFPYNVFKGIVAKKDVKYISFEYMYLSGYPALAAFDRHTETMTHIPLHNTTVTDSKISIYDGQGNRITSIAKDTWVTIMLETHVNSGSSDTVYISTTTEGTSFNIRNVNYWTDDSGKYIVGYNDLFEASVNDLDYAFIGSSVSLSDLINAKYKGVVTKNYTVEDVAIVNTSIATYDQGKVNLLDSGVTQMSFKVKYSEENYSYEESFTLTIKSFGHNTLVLAEDKMQLNVKYESKKSQEINVSILVIGGEILTAKDNLTLQVIEGTDVVSVDGLTVTGLKKGVAKVKVFASLDSGSELAETIDVTVTDTNWSTFVENTTNTFVDGVFTLQNDDVWNDYLVLIDTDGKYGTNPDAPTNWDARQNMIKNENYYISFKVKVTSGTARIYVPILPDQQGYLGISETQMIVDPKFSTQITEIVRLYNAEGKRIADYNKLTANTEYTVVIKYETTSLGWSEVAIKGAKTVVELSDVTFYSSYTFNDEYMTWGLKSDSQNTYSNNKFTLANDIWNDYLTLVACDRMLGTNGLSTTDYAVRQYMIAKNYNYIEFTVKVESGTARIYVPLTGSGQGYVGISQTGIVVDPAHTDVTDYIKVYTMSGTELNTSSTLTSNTEYKVRIKYEHTNATGWAEVAIKGSATVVTVSQASFYAE